MKKSKEELMHDALNHYYESASKRNYYRYDVPKAIKHYYSKPNESMKKILISALTVLFIFAFSYFATAFVTLEFNPKEWAKGVRFFIVFIPTFVSIGFVHIYNLD